jgi:anti-sigma factor RsiW
MAMTCSDFLDRYSDYVDGLIASPAEREPFHRHLAECRRCRRFDAAVRRGVIALRVLPEVTPSRDFRERLDRQLAVVARESGAGPTLLRVAAMLLVAVALVLLGLEGTGRPAAASPPALEPVPFPHPVAHEAPPFVSFQDPRAIILAGGVPLYGAAAPQAPVVYVGGDVVGR